MSFKSYKRLTTYQLIAKIREWAKQPIDKRIWRFKNEG